MCHLKFKFGDAMGCLSKCTWSLTESTISCSWRAHREEKSASWRQSQHKWALLLSPSRHIFTWSSQKRLKATLILHMTSCLHHLYLQACDCGGEMAATKGVYGESRSASCHRLNGKQISLGGAEQVHGVGNLKLSAILGHSAISNWIKFAVTPFPKPKAFSAVPRAPRSFQPD